MREVFCTECREFVMCDVEEREVREVLRGRECTYVAEIVSCPVCGEELYVGEIDDRNMRKLYDEYRKAEGILSVDEIREIPKLFGMSERDLSKMLGWEEDTLSRYCEGKTPSKRYSDMLRELRDNPEKYKR